MSALSNVYDALTSRRAYKPPYSPEAAREIIVNKSGAHFDPVIVTAFLTRFEDFREVARQTDNESRFSSLHCQDGSTEVPVGVMTPG
jgi:putative two-component system response regulator